VTPRQPTVWDPLVKERHLGFERENVNNDKDLPPALVKNELALFDDVNLRTTIHPLQL
jgi:hypothetical protein